MQETIRKGNKKGIAEQMDFGYNDEVNVGLRKRRNNERTLFLTGVNEFNKKANGGRIYLRIGDYM